MTRHKHWKKQMNYVRRSNSICKQPNEGEPVKTLNSTQILKLMQLQYPTLKISHSVKVMLGQAMKELGFEHTEHSHVAFYKAIPLKAA